MTPISWDYIQKFVIVGESYCGKSSILVQLTDKRFLGNNDPTIGVEFGSRLIQIPPPSNKVIKLQIWDTAGQESFRSITRSYYRGASGALLTFDVTRRQTFESIGGWLSDLREYGEDGVVIILVGNKVDLVEGGGVERQVTEEEAREFAEREGLVGYMETSAKTGKNVDETFNKVSLEIHAHLEAGRLERRNMRAGSSFPSILGIGSKGGSCC